MPNSIKVSDLLLTHCDHDAALLVKYADFYEGGQRFERNKSNYLRLRQFEKAGTAAGHAYREQRLSSADYINYVAGLINWLISGCIQSEPSILCGDGPADRTAYWNLLNKNCDGNGQDIAALARSALIEAMIFGKAYALIGFPNSANGYPNLNSQRSAGALDATFTIIPTTCVEDWDDDESGNLLWVRAHSIEYGRSRPYGPQDIERHTWTFYGNEDVVKYRASKKKSELWKAEDVATETDRIAHNMGCNPVKRMRIPRGFWVMNQLYAVAKSLFNREASEDFALDTSALALPVVKTERDIKELLANELAVLKLLPSEDFGWKTPDASHFQSLSSNGEKKRDAMFQVVQSMALQSSNIPSAGRQSALAKQYDNSLLSTLLASFAGYLRDFLEDLVSTGQRVRGDEALNVSIIGLDRFDVQNVDLLLNRAERVERMNVAESAKRYMAQKVALAVCAEAPQDTKSEIITQSKDLSYEGATQPPPGPGSGNPPHGYPAG